jgi:Cu+-exporting ATPase
MRVTATGAETALAQIIAVVQRAQSSRASIQRLADTVSSVFVPTVVLVAIGTALWWGLAPAQARAWHEALAGWLWHASLPDSHLAAALIHAAAVLIVACPCAMGLATPAAIMAGANAAARRGILIRDGTALEKSGHITAIAFDKTGTLTTGVLTVAAIQELETLGEAGWTLQRLAAALAAGSNHPLSRAIASLAPSQGRSLSSVLLGRGVPAATAAMPTSPTAWTPLRPLREMVAVPFNREERGSLAVRAAPNRPPPHVAEFAAWQEVRGRGIEARWQGHIVRLGALDWLLAGNPPAGGAAPFVEEWSGRGATVVGLTVAGRLVGLFALRDEPKPQARDVIVRLRANSKQVFLVTGDSPATAMAIANQLGIPADAVFAAIRPEGKSGVVADLQRGGWRVAFVGDGINDAPALEQADLGIAVSRASDVAREAADLILLRSDIEAVPEALGLAQATLRTIKQNLFWAFFYNAAAIPLAALGFLSPVICAAAMGLSDVLVIGNALRLLRWRAR